MKSLAQPLTALALALAFVLACGGTEQSALAGEGAEKAASAPGIEPGASEGPHQVALLAGGCFWCIESTFDELPGVISAVSGFAGGVEQAPSYRAVASGHTSHKEVVRVVFDPSIVSYDAILRLFWHNIDPFQGNGQFCDKGPHYRSAIYFQDEAQLASAEATKGEVEERFGKPVVTEIAAAGTFWAAEEYHQDFHLKNPVHYQRYRSGCGRDRRLKELWGADAGH